MENTIREHCARLALICGCLAAPALVYAQTQPAPGTAAQRKPIFVTAEQLSAVAILPTPPAPGSWKTLEELAELHRLEQTRTPADIQHAQEDDREESMFAFAEVMGPRFKRADLPLTALLSDHVKNDESIIVNPAKQFFRRTRPFFVDTTLHPVCK